MRVFILFGVFFFAVGVSGFTDQSSDESQILQLEDDWADALKSENRAALDKILAPEFTFIEGDGSVLSREGYLADRGKNPYDITSFEYSELKVSVYGTAALVSGLSTISERGFGKKYHYSLRWKEMWIKNDGHWQVLAGQATPVNSKWNDPFVVP